MARQERPVDPDAGPLSAFAYELRKLRAEAGNPTYRVLARSAGYGATTLSEAAGGVRMPTLEVLLAYVGACHGDLEQWQRRWYETMGRLRAAGDTTARLRAAGERDDREVSGAAVPAPEVSTAGGPVPDVPVPGWSRSRRRRVAVVAVSALAPLVAAAAATWPPPLTGRPGTSTSPEAGRCPGVPTDALFTGVTYGGGAHVRAGATRDDTLLTTIAPHCTVGFTGFCVGEKVYDNTGGTPDVRWFKAAGGGVVSSAVIHGNPPRDEPVSDCPNGRPAPTAVDFSVSADSTGPGAVMLHAHGADLHIVGFTRSTASGLPSHGPGSWRQVSLADVAHPAVGAKVRLDTATAPTAGEWVVVVAAACFGGDSPTGVVEARRVRRDEPGRGEPVTLSPQQRTAAANSACRYPSRG
ncbi:helix-turn-helix domain-containing protein [Micromonospora sp. NPDC050397]|uniref:helix-turn-helix domain-containing protein n=1 Tax=Micromonospora sp. NPDC050397 TaxID=3364279 RepID=UPI00384EB354